VKKWQEVQMKAFTHWVNSVLEKRAIRIINLDEFSDGVTIVHFVECLLDKKLKQKTTKNPRTEIHRIENTHIALEKLKKSFAKKKSNAHITISAEDFIHRNLTQLLGFLWMLFRVFSLQANMGENKDNQSSEDMLLVWLRNITNGYSGIKITNWASINDGLAFLAMIDQYAKRFLNGPLFDYHDRAENFATIQNVTDSFDIAEKNLGLPKLFEPDALVAGNIEERMVVLYVSMFFHAFIHAEEKRKKFDQHEQEITTIKNIQDEELTTLKEKLEETLEQKLRIENLYAELENKYRLLVREHEQYVDESKSRIGNLENENKDLELKISNLTKELDLVKEQANSEKQLSMQALDLLRKNLIEHIRDLSNWKGINTDQEFSIDISSTRIENEIQNLSTDDQISLLAQQLEKENKDILDLWNQKKSTEETKN